ncbi:Zinc finger and SCAN domain-containing protein 29 [Chelonia mydas]|uniref:Zinc finger and SCAN domain-containing protein 29 n=1 Tax=Chelonia mydas TaxID=8469 RepID=M7BF48_CHEMY|nr:Zinc finger and SCAN domain-containing protein 29 [Chelonia mydas]
MQSQYRKRAPAWTEWEVLDLIAVWGEESMLSELCSKRRNAKTVQKISEAMRDRGYNRDATQCRVKLKELRQAYQRTKESKGCSGTGPQTCCFYAELHAILGGAAITTPPLSVDSNDGVLSAMPEDFGEGEDEEEEDKFEESTQHTVLPDSQDLFITLTEIPSQPNQVGEGTSVLQLANHVPFRVNQGLIVARLLPMIHVRCMLLFGCWKPANGKWPCAQRSYDGSKT